MIYQKTKMGLPLTKSFITLTIVEDKLSDDGRRYEEVEFKTDIAWEAVFMLEYKKDGTSLYNRDHYYICTVKESAEEIAKIVEESIKEQEEIERQNKEIAAEERKQEHLKYIAQIEEAKAAQNKE